MSVCGERLRLIPDFRALENPDTDHARPASFKGVQGFHALLPEDAPNSWPEIKGVLPEGVRLSVRHDAICISESVNLPQAEEIGDASAAHLADRVVARRVGSPAFRVTALECGSTETADALKRILPTLGIFGGNIQNLSSADAQCTDPSITVAASPDPSTAALQTITELLGFSYIDRRDMSQNPGRDLAETAGLIALRKQFEKTARVA